MNEAKKAEKELAAYALAFPGAEEAHPWGHLVVKVKKKAFVFLGGDANDGFSMSVKLPASNQAALMFHFAEPTGYGLGKSGWVTASFGKNESLPVDLMRMWIDESYRAVAPKKMVAALPPPPRPSVKRTGAATPPVGEVKKKTKARPKPPAPKKKPAAKKR